jgi:tetratricopeptide (TPR) repeat protein
VQQLSGDCISALASYQQALALFCDFGHQLGQAVALNSLGELSLRTSDPRARDYHSRALAIARDIGAPLEEARALEGIGHSRLRDHDHPEAAGYLQQAHEIYRRIGAPELARVEEALHHQS